MISASARRQCRGGIVDGVERLDEFDDLAGDGLCLDQVAEVAAGMRPAGDLPRVTVADEEAVMSGIRISDDVAGVAAQQILAPVPRPGAGEVVEDLSPTAVAPDAGGGAAAVLGHHQPHGGVVQVQVRLGEHLLADRSDHAAQAIGQLFHPAAGGLHREIDTMPEPVDPLTVQRLTEDVLGVRDLQDQAIAGQTTGDDRWRNRCGDHRFAGIASPIADAHLHAAQEAPRLEIEPLAALFADRHQDTAISVLPLRRSQLDAIFNDIQVCGQRA